MSLRYADITDNDVVLVVQSFNTREDIYHAAQGKKGLFPITLEIIQNDMNNGRYRLLEYQAQNVPTAQSELDKVRSREAEALESRRQLEETGITDATVVRSLDRAIAGLTRNRINAEERLEVARNNEMFWHQLGELLSGVTDTEYDMPAPDGPWRELGTTWGEALMKFLHNKNRPGAHVSMHLLEVRRG